MNITIKINTDNAAFEDNPGAEVARILKDTARKLEERCEDLPGGKYKLFDINGNEVGYVGVKQ